MPLYLHPFILSVDAVAFKYEQQTCIFVVIERTDETRGIIGRVTRYSVLNGTVAVIGLIHDSHHVGFQIVMQISHVLCWGQTLEKGQIAENRLVEILK